jgi:hypothetical protein
MRPPSADMPLNVKSGAGRTPSLQATHATFAVTASHRTTPVFGLRCSNATQSPAVGDGRVIRGEDDGSRLPEPGRDGLPVSSASCLAMWVMTRAGAPPCQWFSPGSK